MSRIQRTEPLESKIVKKIKEGLQARYGGFWFKSHGGAFQVAGLPDLIGCVRGQFIALEVKRPSRVHEITARQTATLMLLNRNAAVTGVVSSLEDAIKRMEEEGIEPLQS